MITFSILLMISQPLWSKKMISIEDYNLIKNNWCVYRGNSVITSYSGENYIGGKDKFDKDTIVQNYYNLHPHSQVNILIRAIFNCVQSFEVQLDDAIQSIDNNQFLNPQPVNMELNYFHSSKSAFFSLSVTRISSCPNPDVWWGLFAIQIHILDCQEDIDYCQPGSNILWKLLKSNMNSYPINWKIHPGNSQVDYSFKDFQITSNVFSGTIDMQRYILIPYPTNVKLLFKLIFESQLSTITISINEIQKIWPINTYYQYNSNCNPNIQFIYCIEIDINEHISDLLSLKVSIQDNSGNNQVSIYDFVVFYQDQDIIQPPSLGCLNWISQFCISCEEGWLYDSLNQICRPICGNGKVEGYEQCDDGNGISNDGCYNCEFQCSLDCQKCQFGKCLIWSNSYIEVNTLQRMQNCHHSKGYYFDFLLNDCVSICGDQIITLEEECDDGNTLLNDGCNNCKFICSDYCLDCQFGKCHLCDSGYKIQQFKCISNCGDQIINIDETCDDGNNIKFDGCHQCQSSCQLQCIICQNSLCIECLSGWNLVDGKCEQNCGDGQVALMSNEQCDDPSINNCIDCLFSFCQDNCLVCNQNECISCLFPFQMINGICQPICGDSIVTFEFEQCDDGNDIPFDGCHQCQYSCSYGCQQCEQDNICKECDQNQFDLDLQTRKCKEKVKLIDHETDQLNSDSNNNSIIQCNSNYVLIDNVCVNLCGNGLLNSHYEECDDGNNSGGDGCSSLCDLETNFLCVSAENELTTCSFIKPPDFKLTKLSEKQNPIQIIELTFSEQVKLNYPINLEEIAVFQIQPQIAHQLIVSPIQNLTINLDNPVYQFIIQFQESIENPILEIQFSKFVISNQYNLDLFNLNKTISLGSPFVLSATTKQQVVSIIKFNDAMMYSMVSIVGLGLLTGNVLMILNLLDLLQSLSYIRYMQYSFPPNLKQFLETYTKVSLSPVLDYFKVDEMIAKFNGGFIPYKRNKPQQQSINKEFIQVYLMNAKSCYFSLLVSIITFLICSIIASQLINQKLFKQFQKNSQNINYLNKLQMFQQKIQKKCQKIKNDYFSLGIFQFYFTILHQLTFSTLLQFPEYSFNTLFESFNSLNAILSLFVLIFISLKVLSITSSRFRDNSKWKYFYQGSRSQFWAIQFKSFQIFRVKFYIFVIVICINYPEIQSILLSMQSFCYLIYLYKFRPSTSKYELIKLMIRESFLMAIFCSFLLYSLDSNNEQLLLYGWIHIFLFSFILSTNLVVDMIEHFYKAYQNYQKRKIKQEYKEYLKYYDNPLQRFILIEQQQHIII